MPNPDQYCAGLARAVRDDWQYSRLFMPTAGRAGFTALLALREELRRLRQSATEMSIALTKLEWWREEISAAFAGNGQHPVSIALSGHLPAHGVAAEYCLELVDAAETELNPTEISTEADLQLFRYRRDGVMSELLVQLSGHTSRDIVRAARLIGEGRSQFDIIRSLGAYAAHGRCLLPAETLERAGIAIELLQQKNEVALTLVRNEIAKLDELRVTARTAMENIFVPGAALIQWRLQEQELPRYRRNPALALAPIQASVSPFYKLWTAWRTARRQARMQHEQE